MRYLLGQIAEDQKLWPRAIEWYDSIERGDHVLPARMRTANAIAKQGKLDEARAYLKRVAARESGATRCSSRSPRRSCCATRTGTRTPSTCSSEALRRGARAPELLYDRALTAEKLERFDLLESDLRKLIQMKPDHAHAYNALGYSLAERNDAPARGAAS